MMSEHEESQSFSDQYVLISHCDDRKAKSRITASRCRAIYKEMVGLLDVKMWMSWYSWARGLSLSVPRYIATLTKFQRARRLLLVQPNRQNQCWKCPKVSVKETLSFSPWRQLETVLCLRKVAGFHRHKYVWKCPHKVELRSLAWQRCCFVIIWLEGQTNRGQTKHHVQTALLFIVWKF